MELLLQNAERNCLASQNEERKKGKQKKIAVHFLDVEEIQREIKFC